MRGIIVFGAGGHAKVVVDAIDCTGRYQAVHLADDQEDLRGTQFCGHHVVGGRKEVLELRASRPAAIAAVGDNLVRLDILRWLHASGFELDTVIHPSAVVARRTSIGAGTFLAPGAIVNVDSTVGEGVIINTAASVDHDCTLGDGVHLGPGSRLCGGVSVGRGSLIGAGTIIVPGVRIGESVVVGAGSVVLCDVPAGDRIAGSPAARLESRQ